MRGCYNSQLSGLLDHGITQDRKPRREKSVEEASGQVLSCGQGQFPAFERSNWAHRTFLGGAFLTSPETVCCVFLLSETHTHHEKTRADGIRRRMRSGTTRAAERRAIIFP